MPTDKILKFKRGNTTKNNAYTGSDGELTVDRTKKTLVVHDGINAGGSPLATEESVNNVIQELENKVDINENITTQGNLFNGLDQLVKLDSSGKLPAIDGSQLTGVASGSLVNSGVSAGTYKSVTVNSKGIITAGTNPTTLNEYGITDAATSSSLNIEKGRIDAILLATDANADTFAEVVTLVNSIDTTNDQAFAGYVLSNDVRSATIEGNVTNLTSSKADKATTYTKSETDAKIVELAPATDISGKADIGHTHIKSEVGLSNVDNTSDINKPISNATITALALKANTADLKELGVGQTWQSFTVGTQRISGTTYTNSTGKPITVFLNININTGGGATMVINGLSTFINIGYSGVAIPYTIIVPNGNTYQITAPQGILTWAELR